MSTDLLKHSKAGKKIQCKVSVLMLGAETMKWASSLLQQLSRLKQKCLS